MKTVVAKLKKTIINPHITYLAFNACIMKSVYFRCGIIELHEKEEEILKKEYEETILVKLELSKKFPRSILYMRKLALVIGLIRLSTAIQLQVIKLYIGNKRAQNTISKALTLYEEMIFVEKGRNADLK